MTQLFVTPFLVDYRNDPTFRRDRREARRRLDAPQLIAPRKRENRGRCRGFPSRRRMDYLLPCLSFICF